MHHRPAYGPPGRGLFVALAACLASLAGAGAAQAAAVTASNITAPADGSVFLYDSTSTAAQNLTVTGTSNGTAGAVDIGCYQGGQPHGIWNGASSGTGPGIPVGADGTFSASVPMDWFAGRSCELLAVPHSSVPLFPTGFTGPRVAVSEFELFPSGGPGSPLYDFAFTDSTLTVTDAINSSGACGLYSVLADGSATMNASPGPIACAGDLYGRWPDFDGHELTRSEILVDGQNAYSSPSASALFPGATSVPGFPPLVATLDAFDPSTAEAQTTESENLVECSPTNVANPTASDCTSFAATGVKFQRVSEFTHDAQVVTETDTYTSTDGASHTLDVQYETDLNNPAAGWQLPGQSSFTEHSTGDTAPAATSAPGTIYAILDSTQAPSFSNPVAAMTFGSPYDSIAFDDTIFGGADSALFDFQRTVPAGGSVTIQWSYSTGTSMAEVQGDAASAEDLFSPPTIGISSPASGATLTSSPVTVTGTASAFTGVKSVNVNGVTANLSGSGGFTATVPLTLGKNTLTATVTTNSGATKTASETVSYTGVPPVATTGGASSVGSSTAKVSGTVTPGANAGTYYFQYGKTTGYGQQTKPVSIAAGNSAVSVSAKLTGLTPHARYHYRLVATSTAGTSYGSDRTFTTLYALRGMTVEVSGRHVSGKLKLPHGVSRAQGCKGTVTVAAKHGSKKTVRVSKRCTYAASLKGHGKLKVVATFNGNSLIGPFTAKAG